MFSTALIFFREVLELSLLTGVLLAATRNARGRTPWIFGGLLAGLAGSAMLAVFTGRLQEALQGRGQEYFNAAVLLAAALLLAYTVLWMAQQSRDFSATLREAGREVTEGSRSFAALALLIFLTSLREGSEIVLFTYGVVAAGEGGHGLWLGALAGTGLGGLLGVLLYAGLLRIPLGRVFALLSLFLTLLAAGMVVQALGFLTAVRVLPELGSPAWDASGLLPEAGPAGSILHAVLGYTDRPCGIQVIGFAVALASIALLPRRRRRKSPASISDTTD